MSNAVAAEFIPQGAAVFLTPTGEVAAVPTVSAGGAGSANPNRCKDCRFWRGPVAADALDWPAPCGHSKVSAKGDRYPDGATGERLNGVYTGPDFGCVHWEGKTDG